jgi:MFS family permease
MIDFFIVNVALPTMAVDLHASTAVLELVVAGYATSYAVLLVVGGRLGDARGRRKMFSYGISAFTLASLLCGIAPTATTLVLARVLQGAAAAMLVPQTLSTIQATGDMVSRARALGWFGATGGLAAVVGQVLGGSLVSANIAGSGWRPIFLVNVPIGIVVVLLAVRYIPAGRAGGRRDPLDVVGAGLLAGGILAAMLGISLLGSGNLPVLSPAFVGPELFGVVLLGLFVRHVHRAEFPFIEPRMLHGRSFGSLNLINLLYGSAVLGFGALVPLYAVTRFHIAPLASGSLLNARAVGMIVTSLAASWVLPRTGYRRPLVVGFSLTALGLLTMSATPLIGTPYAWLAVAAGLTGIGMGTTGPASMNASLQLATKDVAAIASLRQMFRQFGSITAVSISTAIVSRASDRGIVLSHIFDVFAALLICALPLMLLIPEHRGDW